MGVGSWVASSTHTLPHLSKCFIIWHQSSKLKTTVSPNLKHVIQALGFLTGYWQAKERVTCARQAHEQPDTPPGMVAPAEVFLAGGGSRQRAGFSSTVRESSRPHGIQLTGVTNCTDDLSGLKPRRGTHQKRATKCAPPVNRANLDYLRGFHEGIFHTWSRFLSLFVCQGLKVRTPCTQAARPHALSMSASPRGFGPLP